MAILITGGAGYIGSHTLVSLSEAGYDNLPNSSKESIKKVEKLISKNVSFEDDDIRDKRSLEMEEQNILYNKALIVNLGTGKGYSVLDMVKAFEKASGKKVPYKIVNRRYGDIAKCYANPSFAKEVLEWDAKKTIDDMCIDSWKWQSNNPDGYKGKSE